MCACAQDAVSSADEHKLNTGNVMLEVSMKCRPMAHGVGPLYRGRPHIVSADALLSQGSFLLVGRGC